MDILETIVESTVHVRFDFKKQLTKDDLGHIVAEAFPGAKEVTAGHQSNAQDSGMPAPLPGVLITTGNLSLFFASDKCVVTYKGRMLKDCFLETALMNLKRVIEASNPTGVILLSYCEKSIKPVSSLGVLDVRMDGFDLIDDNHTTIYRAPDSGAFVQVEKRCMSRKENPSQKGVCVEVEAVIQPLKADKTNLFEATGNQLGELRTCVRKGLDANMRILA